MAEPIITGDRAVFTGNGQLSGRACDVTHAGPRFSSARFDNGRAVLVPTTGLSPIVRRPAPMF